MDRFPSGITYAERNLLFRNRGDGKFDEVGLRSGPGLAVRKVSRGLATADYDNDGDLEIAVTHMNDTPDLLRDQRPNPNRSILVKLIGASSNRDGIGTEVKVTAGSLTQYDTVRSGGSYLSSSDLRLHFGLGSAIKVDRLELRWPSPPARQTQGTKGDRSNEARNETQIILNEAADQLLVIKEAVGVIKREPLRRH
jgi:hypothetical protein